MLKKYNFFNQVNNIDVVFRETQAFGHASKVALKRGLNEISPKSLVGLAQNLAQIMLLMTMKPNGFSDQTTFPLASETFQGFSEKI